MDVPPELSERLRPAKDHDWPLRANRKERKESGFTLTKLSDVTNHAGPDALREVPPGNVAAIDFGSTYCSIAFSTEGDDEVSTMRLNEYHARVPTAILLQKTTESLTDDKTKVTHFEVLSFGYDAQASYEKLRQKELRNYLYFDRMKMTLQHDQNVTRDMTITAYDGTLWYLIEVIATILRHLKEQLEKHLSKTVNPLKATEFNWIITVPAIWQDRGKRMMREAGYLAGLCSDTHVIQHLTEPAPGKELARPPETNQHRLTLAPEPEAAANYCQQMKESDLAKHFKVDTSDGLQSSRYMVIDVGGGTVDIAAYQVDESNNIHVLRSPTGNDCGGIMVNLEFIKLLQLIFGEKPTVVKHGSSLEQCFPELLSPSDPILSAVRKSGLNLLIYKNFEDEKERLGSKIGIHESSIEEMRIKLPEKILAYYGTDRIQSNISSHFSDQVDLEEGVLYLQNQLSMRLFAPALEGIIQCTRIVLHDMKGQVDTIYLVGGFGGCKYVCEHVHELVKSDFSDQSVRVIVPVGHKLAVAQGAAKYKQQKVSSRMIDATYGIGVSVVYDQSHHKEEYFRYSEDGDEICIDTFLTFGAKGDVVKAEDVFIDEVIPGVENEKVIKIPIMRSTQSSLEYITERSASGEITKHLADKVGELEIQIPEGDILSRDQRTFRIMLDFTQSEVKARACYVTNNQEVNTVLNFLATQ